MFVKPTAVCRLIRTDVTMTIQVTHWQSRKNFHRDLEKDQETPEWRLIILCKMVLSMVSLYKKNESIAIRKVI